MCRATPNVVFFGMLIAGICLSQGVLADTPSREQVPRTRDQKLSMRQWRHIVRSPTPRDGSPVLRYEQITSVKNIADLKRLYGTAGKKLDTAGVARQVVHDWFYAFQNAVGRAVRSLDGPLPERLPGLLAEVNGNPVHLYGLPHPQNPASLGSRVWEVFGKTRNARRNAVGLVEQHIFQGGSSREFGLLELPDHSVPRLWERWYTAGPKMFVMLARKWANRIRIRTKTKAGEYTDNQGTVDIPQPGSARWYEMALRMPVGIATTAPAFVELEIRAALGRYTAIQRRSGYMAEILRMLDRPVFSVSGGTHVPEAVYFLEHPINDARVQRLAQAHTDAYSKGGLPALNRAFQRALAKDLWLVQMPAPLATGAFGGGLISELYKLL